MTLVADGSRANYRAIDGAVISEHLLLQANGLLLVGVLSLNKTNANIEMETDKQSTFHYFIIIALHWSSDRNIFIFEEVPPLYLILAYLGISKSSYLVLLAERATYKFIFRFSCAHASLCMLASAYMKLLIVLISMLNTLEMVYIQSHLLFSPPCVRCVYVCFLRL